MKYTRIVPVFFAITALSLAGCETASVERPAGFLRDYSVLNEGTFFKQQFVARDADFSKYRSVKVVPVNFDYLMDKTVADPGDLEDLGRAFRKDIEKALAEKGFKVTQYPTKGTLILAVAVTDIEIPDRVFNAAKSLAPYGIGFIPTDTNGRTAFEGKFIDAETGRTVIEVAEKQSGSGSQINIKAMAIGGYMKFVNAEACFNGWSKQLAAMLDELKKQR
ncbi:MAG TPA: DUF3313 family protein [bacterium]|nr:DUF3313 family protein [bacterium]